LVEAANGNLLLGEQGKHSSAIAWEQVQKADPEYLIVAPCGFNLERAREELPSLERLPGWFKLAAGKAHVAVADGNKYFNRSGTTVVEAVEIIAEILHGYKSESALHNTAWQMVTYPAIQAEESCRA
jgi:iron complex transport system substrate-binding protein